MFFNIAFIITSVINTISTDLTYGRRSFYDMNERFEQTLQTIHSIRSYVPNADIYLIEGSQITFNMEFVFESLVNKYVNVFNDKYIRRSVESKLKGYGEAAQIHYIFNKYDMTKYEYIFKISGRYYLNSDFNLKTVINNNDITFCKGKHSEIVSTVLYMIPKRKISELVECYKLATKIYNEYNNRVLRGDIISLHYERIIPKLLKTYNVLDKIGVEGLVSSYKTLYKC
jgi:hypothetical protein